MQSNFRVPIENKWLVRLPDSSDVRVQSCVVCGEASDQVAQHYTRLLCNGCRAFFKRTVQGKVRMGKCKAQGRCIIDTNSRKSCKPCRYQACLRAGVDSSKVQPPRDTSEETSHGSMNFSEQPQGSSPPLSHQQDIESVNPHVAATTDANSNSVPYQQAPAPMSMQQSASLHMGGNSVHTVPRNHGWLPLFYNLPPPSEPAGNPLGGSFPRFSLPELPQAKVSYVSYPPNLPMNYLSVLRNHFVLPCTEASTAAATGPAANFLPGPPSHHQVFPSPSGFRPDLVRRDLIQTPVDAPNPSIFACNSVPGMRAPYSPISNPVAADVDRNVHIPPGVRTFYESAPGAVRYTPETYFNRGSPLRVDRKAKAETSTTNTISGLSASALAFSGAPPGSSGQTPPLPGTTPADSATSAVLDVENKQGSVAEDEEPRAQDIQAGDKLRRAQSLEGADEVPHAQGNDESNDAAQTQGNEAAEEEDSTQAISDLADGILSTSLSHSAHLPQRHTTGHEQPKDRPQAQSNMDYVDHTHSKQPRAVSISPPDVCIQRTVERNHMGLNQSSKECRPRGNSPIKASSHVREICPKAELAKLVKIVPASTNSCSFTIDAILNSQHLASDRSPRSVNSRVFPSNSPSASTSSSVFPQSRRRLDTVLSSDDQHKTTMRLPPPSSFLSDEPLEKLPSFDKSFCKDDADRTDKGSTCISQNGDVNYDLETTDPREVRYSSTLTSSHDQPSTKGHQDPSPFSSPSNCSHQPSSEEINVVDFTSSEDSNLVYPPLPIHADKTSVEPSDHLDDSLEEVDVSLLLNGVSMSCRKTATSSRKTDSSDVKAVRKDREVGEANEQGAEVTPQSHGSSDTSCSNAGLYVSKHSELSDHFSNSYCQQSEVAEYADPTQSFTEDPDCLAAKGSQHKEMPGLCSDIISESDADSVFSDDREALEPPLLQPCDTAGESDIGSESKPTPPGHAPGEPDDTHDVLTPPPVIQRNPSTPEQIDRGSPNAHTTTTTTTTSPGKRKSKDVENSHSLCQSPAKVSPGKRKCLAEIPENSPADNPNSSSADSFLKDVNGDAVLHQAPHLQRRRSRCLAFSSSSEDEMPRPRPKRPLSKRPRPKFTSTPIVHAGQLQSLQKERSYDFQDILHICGEFFQREESAQNNSAFQSPAQGQKQPQPNAGPKSDSSTHVQSSPIFVSSRPSDDPESSQRMSSSPSGKVPSVSALLEAAAAASSVSSLCRAKPSSVATEGGPHSPHGAGTPDSGVASMLETTGSDSSVLIQESIKSKILTDPNYTMSQFKQDVLRYQRMSTSVSTGPQQVDSSSDHPTAKISSPKQQQSGTRK